MDVSVDKRHVVQTDRSAQCKLVQTRAEVCVDESSMEHGEADRTTNKSKVI